MTLFLNRKIFIILFFFSLGLTLSFAFDPYNLPFCSLIVIGIFFLLNDKIYYLYKKSYFFIFLTGLSFGFAFFLSSMYWLSNAIFVYDDLNYLLPFTLIGLPLLLSIFFGFMQTLNLYFWSDSAWRIVYFSILWTISEMTRGIIFTGLPWNLLAYSWTWSLYIMQSLSLFGVYGLCFITTLMAASFFSIRLNKISLILSSASFLILIALFIFGFLRVNSHKDIFSDTNKIRLISTNFEQKNKWLDKSIEEVMSLGSDRLITIFPETSIGFKKKIPSNWLTGSVRQKEGKFYNSIQFNDHIYDKRKLVPFTEFLPFEKLVRILDYEKKIPENFFHSGKKNQVFFSSYLPLICYDGIFPNITLSSLTQEHQLIINISNDAWFGSGLGPKQQLTHVRYRSIETGLPLIRSTNKGFSVLVNPIGQIIESIPINTTGYIDIVIPDKIKQTVYSIYKDYLIIFFIVLILFIRYIHKNFFIKKA